MIRRARAGDWEAVRGLWREVDELHARLVPAYFRAPARTAGEWAQMLAAPDAAVLVAVAEGAVAGAASVRLYETPLDPGMVAHRRGHVEMLVVAAAHRRRGLGRALMDEAAAWTRRQGGAELVLTVWDGNADAQAFYERLGYRVLSRVLHTVL